MSKRSVLLVFVCLAAAAPWAQAASRDMIRCVPEHSWTVIGADFAPLRANDIYLDLENHGKIWTTGEDSELSDYFRLLHIDPKTDVRSFLYARYINSYGVKGHLEMIETARDIADVLAKNEMTPYLGASIYTVDAGQDMRAAWVAPSLLALGSLNEVKTAIDVYNGKLRGIDHNVAFSALLGKLPRTAAVWGAAIPLSRREAAKLGAKQETHPVLEAFENYYFYGVPSKNTVDAHFLGEATSEGQAAFVSTFMLGTITYARLRSDEDVADALDTIDVQRKGKSIQVAAVVTKTLVDAYLQGNLGVK